MSAALLRAQLLCRVGGELLEGPSWVPGELRFVDILRSERLSYAPAGRLQRERAGESCSAWIPRRSGGSILATRTGLRFYDAAGVDEHLLELEADRPENRANDAKCDPDGRLWVGTMPDAGDTPTGALYRVDHGRVARILEGMTISNGLGWSAGGERMYHIDTPSRRIDVLDYALLTGDVGDG